MSYLCYVYGKETPLGLLTGQASALRESFPAFGGLFLRLTVSLAICARKEQCNTSLQTMDIIIIISLSFGFIKNSVSRRCLQISPRSRTLKLYPQT